MEILGLFTRGGLIMYPIAAASVLALAIFLERLYSLRQSEIAPEDFSEKIFGLVAQNEVTTAKNLCESQNSPLARLFGMVLRRGNLPIPILKESVEEEGRFEASKLERFVEILGTIAALGPLMGLLGTVIGIIRTFQSVASTGIATPTAMASGIWEALLTTAFGLIVGIIALIAYRFLIARIDKLVLILERDTLKLVEILKVQQSS